MDESDRKVLKAVQSLDFPVGKNLLADLLFGKETSQVSRLGFTGNEFFGSLDLQQRQEIRERIDNLVYMDYLEVRKEARSKFYPVLFVTERGKSLLEGREKEGAHASKPVHYDPKIFESFGEFLERFNDDQKYAIIAPEKRILCIAGAGSGKTTVLTKRIEFLSKYKNIGHSRILAITFTRKARQEMIERLGSLVPGNRFRIETFNSFCERQLQRKGERIYDKEYRVLDGRARIRLVQKALKDMGYSREAAVEDYFSAKKNHTLDNRQKFFIMLNDIYSIMDNLRNMGLRVKDFGTKVACISNFKEKRSCVLANEIIKRVVQYKEEMGLRDYTDQMVHCLELFKKERSMVPKFEHVLVDEYQDVNHLQVELLEQLDPPNLFCVGDPRQSIFGWRGSRIKYITGFTGIYPDSVSVQLSRNYRSTERIVELANRSIKPMKLPDISAVEDKGEDVRVVEHDNEDDEGLFIAQSIISQDVPRNEIFVLARTNKQLDTVSRYLDEFRIRYLKRTVEEQQQHLMPGPDQVTLSTIHAIKGLEADTVYMIGVNTNNYPCRAQDHPALECAKVEDYDKYAEELRVFYVGLTRARKRLVISYFNTKSKFLDDNETLPQFFKTKKSDNLTDTLRKWRAETSKGLGVPAYFIFNDRTMLAIAASRPTNLGELSMIPGMSPTKVNRYGLEIIDMIKGF